MSSLIRKLWKKGGHNGGAKTGRRNKVLLEPLEPRVLLSADASLPGVGASLAEGLISFSDRIESYANQELDFQTAIPGILQTHQDIDGDGSVDETDIHIPTEITVAVDYDRNGEIQAISGVDKTDLADVYNYVQDFWAFGRTVEQRLNAMDLDNDRVVDWNEAYKVFVVGGASSYLEDFEYNPLSPLTATQQIEYGLRTFLDDLAGHSSLEDIIDIDLTDVSIRSGASLFGHQFDISLTLTDNFVLDLGLEADELEISMPQKVWNIDGSGTRADVLFKPDVLLSQAFTASFAYSFDISTAPTVIDPLTVDDFGFYAEKIFFDRTANDPLLGQIVNIGFLGTQIMDAVNSHYTLDMGYGIEIIDPSSPLNLGFADEGADLTTFSASESDGVLEAQNAPRAFTFASDIIFTLKFGSNSFEPVEVTLTAASTMDNPLTLLTDETNTSISDLRDDLQLAIDTAGLGGLIEALVIGDKLALSWPQTNSLPLGFDNELFDDDENGTVLLAASGEPLGDGATIYEFTDDVRFLLSIDGGLPQLVTIPATDTAVEELGFAPQEDAVLPNLVAANALPADGQFTDTDDPLADPPVVVADNKTFTVTVNTTTGTPVSADITITEAAWSDNTGRSNLVQDINDAIALSSSLNGKVSASLSLLGGKLVLDGLAGVTSIEVSGPDAAEFGFGPDQATYLRVVADADATAELSALGTFDVNVTLAGGTTYTKTVTVGPMTAGTDLEHYLVAINMDLAGSDIHAFAEGGRIVLEVKALEATDVASFEVKVPRITKGNTTIGDLVEDINRVFEDMGINSVEAQANADDMLELVQLGAAAGDPVESLEITRTLTMGADNTITHEEWEDASTDALFVSTPDTVNETFDLVMNLDPRGGINFLPSTDPADPTLEVHLKPFSDAIETDTDDSGIERFRLDLELNNFDQYLDFNVIGPGEIVGLVTQLVGWLDRLPATYMLGNYSIPFAKAVLGDILDFGDMVEDRLLINDYDDGVQPADTTGVALLKFVDDPNSLTISFDTAQELAARLMFLNLLKEIGTGSGVYADYDEDPASPTYRQLIFHLGFDHDLLPDDPDTAVNEKIADVDFSLDLAPLNGLYSGSKVSLQALGHFDALVGIAMGDARKLELTDFLEDLTIASGKSVLETINQDLAVTGADDVAVISGRLTADQSFKLKLTVDGEVLTATVKVTQESTEANTEFSDLADVINAAIAATPVYDADNTEIGTLDAYIAAGLDGSRIRLSAVTDDVQLFEIAGQTSTTTWTYGSLVLPKIFFVAGSSQLGLVEGFASTVQVGATNPIVGDLVRAVGGARFVITLDDGDTGTITIAEDEYNIVIGDLINDINAAMVGTDIEGRILAVQENSRIVFKAIDESVSAFSVASTGLNKLGFTSFVASPNDAPGNGVLGDDVHIAFDVFTQSLMGQSTYSHAIDITAESTAGNTTLDDLVHDLNRAIQSVQALINFGIVAERGVGDTLVFRSTWSGGYGDYFEKLEVTVTAASDQMGFVSGETRESQSLQVAGVFLTAENDVLSQTGRLTQDAVFEITFAGELTGHEVTIDFNDTKLNTSVSDLIEDINLAIDGITELAGKVRAEVVNNFRIVLRATDLSVGGFTLTADPLDPAVTQLGFGSEQHATSELRVVGTKDAPSYVGLSGDASFIVTVKLDGGDILQETVTLDMDETLGNQSIFDLVSDVNRALNAAFGTAADNPLIAGNDGQRLVISPKPGSGVATFGITVAPADPATTDLKLYDLRYSPGAVTFNANEWDLLIRTRDGGIHPVTLDYCLTIGQVITEIQVQTGDKVIASLNAALTGLDLEDKTAGTSLFQVDTVNSSGAALGLGIFAADTNSISEGPDGIIEGQPISPLKLADRLFLRQVDADTPILSADVTLASDLPNTADVENIVATGNYGFVGVELTGGGTIKSTVDLALQGSLPAYGAKLSELIRSVSQDMNGDGDLNVFDLAEYVEFPFVAYDDAFKTLTFDMAIKPALAEITMGAAPKITMTITDAGNPFYVPSGSRTPFAPETVLDVIETLFNPLLAVALAENTITINAHGYATGDVVRYRVGGASTQMEGLEDGTYYYVIEVDENTIRLAATRSAATAETPIAIDLTTIGTGDEHYLDVVGDTLTLTSHGLHTGDRVTYSNGPGGTDIGGLTSGNTFFVIKDDSSTFRLATTAANAANGVAINLTTLGTGAEHRLDAFLPVPPTIDVGTPDIGALANFEEISFDQFLAALQGLNDFLQEYASMPFLDTELPLIGVSVNDLVGIVDRFNTAVTEIEQNQAGSIQLVEQKILETFGLPTGTDVFGLQLIDKDGDAVPNDRDLLKITLNFSKAFSEALPVNIDLTEVLPPSLDLDALQLLGTAGLGTSGSLTAKLAFGVDLDSVSNIFLFTNEADTSISGTLHASADNLAFNAALGSLGVYIKEGNADFDLNFSFKTSAAPGSRELIQDAYDDFSAKLTGSAEATLPVFFPSQSNFRGDIGLTASFGLSGGGLTKNIDLRVDDGIFELDFSSFNLFDNIALMVEAGDLFLMGLQDILDGEVFGFKLPLVGDKLSAGADFIEDFRLDFIQPLRDLVENAPEKAEEIITEFLFDTLMSTGLLMDLDGTALDGGETATDVIMVTKNLDPGDSTVDFAQWNFVLGQTFQPNVNFDFDLGFDALGLDADVGLDVDFTWTLGLGLGISLTEGAYIDITREDYGNPLNTDEDPNNNTDPIPELEVAISAALKESSNIGGRLLFLELVIDEGFDPANAAETGFYFEDSHSYADLTPGSDATQFYASFSIDLVNSNDASDERLALSELGSIGFDAKLKADAEVNLDVRVQFNDKLLPSTVAALLPAIETGFVLDWQVDIDFSDDSGESIGDILGNGLKYVAFTDTYLDLGSFLGELIVPLVDKIQEVTEPLQPIIDVVTARIPVLSDLAGRTVTLVDIAATFGEINPDLIYAIADIVSFVNSIPTNIESLMIPVADEFVIFGSGIVTGAQLADPNFKIADNVDDSVFSSAASQQLFNAAGEFIGGALLGDTGTGTALKGLLGGDYNTETDNGKYGFAFPILEDLGQVFGLLLGKPAVLVTYDLPPFFMDFTMEMSFPIYPPLYGVVSAGVGLQIDFAFGYDTQGIQDFIEGGASNPLDLLSGLYISDTDNPDGSFGTDVPELKLWGGIGVGAELNLGFASAGVMADITITFNFDLYDPDSDGRVRITELVGTFMNEINNGDPVKAPLAIFDIYGDIAFQLSAYIEILFAKFDFDITPRIVIWEFEIPFERPPILATERGDGSLLLNIGPNSGARLNGDTRDIDEDIYVKDAGGGKVAVWGMGVSESAAQIYDANAIYGYGGEGNDTIDLHQVGSVPVYLEGGSGNDTLLGGGRDDSIHGGIGDDSIDGGGGHDRLWGDEGHDFVRGGAGNDFIFGDGAFLAAERITALGSDKDGNDTIYGDGGNDVIFGAGGDDSIYGGDNAGGADGYDLIFGDSGRIELGAGGALPESGGVWNLAKLSARGLVSGNDLIFGNAGTDLVFGGKGDDIIDGGADHDVLYGNEGFDTVYGGGGEDEIYGGTEDDRIFGGRDDLVDAAKRDITDATADLKDIIYGEVGNDFIRGNLGNDNIHGQRGADIIFGDEDDDTIYGEGDPDFIFGGAGNDYIEGQAGNDAIFGDDGIIVYVDFYGIGSHKVIGLVDVDVDPDPMVEDLVPTPDVHTVDSGTLYALDPYIESNDDFGATNPTETRNRTLDLLLTLVNGATDGNDTVIGGEGDDLAFGGAKNDILFGDLDPAKPLSGPVPAGEDILIGDGGRVQYFGRRLDHVSTVVAASALETGADAVSGNGADDLIFGGGGNDTLYGRMDSSYPGPNEDPLLTDNDIIVGDDGLIDYTAGTGVIEKIATTISMPAIVTGGSDIAYGNIGDDIIFGGMKGDTLYGDGSTGGDDIILGDNGQIDFTGGVIDRISTTDTFEASGGPDTIDGQGGNDIILGGVNNDDGAGDPEVDLIVGNLGDDVILGDNGLLDFAFGGDADLTTLDLIQSEIKGLGGEDHISGNAGEDVVIGSTGGDIIYGDASGAPAGAADGQDILLGDNGIIRLLGDVDGRLTVRGTAVRFIHTTDENNDYGGADTIEGNAEADVIIGGVNGTDTTAMDELYGDALSPDIHDGNDLILGDNALLHFAYDGDTDLETLDIVATRPYKVGEASILDETFLVDDSVILGGDDLIAGHTGSDAAFGGVGSDIIYGDAASPGTTDEGDILVGDNAEILLDGYVDAALYVLDSAVRLIQTTDTEEPTGGADTISGNAGADVILGGVNNGGTDVLYGDQAVPTAPSIAADGDDVLLGDNGLLDFAFGDADLTILDLIRSSEDGLGGADIISGNKGLDAAIGGTGGDVIYGDDATASAAGADLGDLLLGDNADVFLTARGEAIGGDLKTVLGSAVYLIRTTDEEHPEYGGSDTISGNADGDIIAGGVYGDTIYGDRFDPTTDGGKNTTLLDGDDIVLGDNGAFEWLSTGRLSEVLGIDVEANNPALWAKYGTGTADTDLSTLDLVTTEQPNSGGRDLIYGDNGRDMMFGGTDSDEMYGDDGDGVGAADNNDLMFGDHGRLYPQFSALRAPGQDWRLAFNSRNFFAIDTGDGHGGEGDRMWGEEGDDGMLGQQGDDRMWGGSGSDDMTGGHNVSGGRDELTTTAIDAALGSPIAMPDIDKVNDIMDGGTGDDAMAGDNAIVWRRGDDLSPRFRALTADAIYTTTNSTIDANIGAEWQSDPADAIGRDIELVDHADTTAIGLYGADVMAGGADSDVMFGQLANDLMQGDGFIGADDGNAETITYLVTVEDDVDPDEDLYFNIPEAASDGDDYMEGSGDDDLMFGGLGQDDIIGGNSALFGLVAEEMRPDGSDVIFGGAGIRIGRNDPGMAVEDSDGNLVTAADGHARDADYIMGDNANVYRLVQGGASGTNPDDAADIFLTFNYDNYGTLRIIPRAMQQLDYTLGGADFAGGSYTAWGAANAETGMADFIHGEAGDDIIFGMTGSDIVFGDGQDDDIVGGYGHDWISAGTGRDGVLGDDGLVLTSRNSTLGEPLYGIEGLLAKDPRPKYSDGNVLNEIIYTPGSIQYAVINVEGELKKTMDLVPFSFDPLWMATDDEFPDNQDGFPYADDIVFGGLGSDWLHGGSGDDAISGAEALEHAYVPVYAANGDPYTVLDLGYLAVGLAPGKTQNPGDVLAFNPLDADGQHLNNRFRAGEFDLYDEYDPRRIILLTPEGELYKGTGGTEGVDYYPFLLNFNTDEGVIRPAGTVPKATGQQTETYPQVWDDGRDAVFGDNGNDWLVGGTGADDVFGGWGNDLLNADDDHSTNGNLNDIPDTHPFYQDRAYGGAGRDVLIGNTGGDRLIDWVGEYNSYLVPYAPFGQASVSRTLQPFLPEFLYALSAGDGADFTRPGDTGADPLRNGEPDAELGLVLQKDFAWQDQTGAPADPQAGNIPGGARDVLRSAGFNDGTSEAFFVDSGVWSVVSGRYQVAPTALGGDALSVFYVDEYIPSYFEMLATIRAVKPTGGYGANAYLVFDYQNSEDFKFAGINVSTSKLEIGFHDASGWHVLVQAPYTSSLRADTDYNVFLALNGGTATLRVNNKTTLTYTFDPRVDGYGIEHFLHEGMVGLGADNSRAAIDNVVVQRIAPEMTSTQTVEFSSQAEFEGLFQTPVNGIADGGSLTLSAAPGGTAVDLADMRIAPASVLSLETVLRTDNQGGFVFDSYGPQDFKFVALSVESGNILIGHSTAKGGIVIDAERVATLDSGTDYTLGITIAERTVSVTLDGGAALSFAFNALITDGEFGLLARNGDVLFDRLVVRTDDPAYATPALPTISVSDASVTEGDGGQKTVEVTLTLSAEWDAPVTVAYATVAGTAQAGEDYLEQNGTVTFDPGETSRTLTFTVNGDDAVEPDETFTIELFDSENAVIADKAGLVTIVNDDAPAPTVPAVSVSDASVQEGDKTNKTKVSVTISLSAATTDTVSVRLKTQDGTAWSGFDYVAADTAITFAPGETSKTYTLTVNGDKVAEFDETFDVVLSEAVGATIADGVGTVTIRNDDGTPLTASGLAGAEMGGVQLTGAELEPVVDAAIAQWAGALGEDAVASLHDVEFQVGEFSGRVLGLTGGNTVLMDADAAGYGWFVDPTPWDDAEFTAGAAPAGMDLLTAVMHEFGHILGFRDVPAALDSLMSGTLEEGVRRLPEDMPALTMPETSKSSLLHFAPPSNGIPSGWVFEHGKVIDDAAGNGWLGKVMQRFKGRKAHGDLPALVELTNGAALHNPAEGVEETAQLLVRLDVTGQAEQPDHAPAVQGASWLGDFLLDGNGRSNPNRKIKIEL